MVTVEFKKDYTHFSNNWKKGDRPTISRDLAYRLEKQGIVKILDDINESILKQAVEEEE